MPAWTAAALAADKGVEPAGVPVRRLQEILREHKAILEVPR